MNKAAEIFFNNPYSVLGVSCIADNLEIIKAQEKIERLAKLGAEKSYKTKYTSNNFPNIDRSSGVVQTAISNIDNPIHKLFWFSDSSAIENYDSTLLMVEVLYEPEQIEYDVFLLEYIDLICNDSSCTQIDRWKKLFRIISWYLNNSSEINKFLSPRKFENAQFLFSENILNPISEICSQTEFEIGIKLLNILKDINSEETLPLQFKELENDIIDSIIEQLETMISNKTSFAEGINLNSTISSETINLANQTAKDIENICQTYLDSLLSIADPVSSDRIKDTVYAALNVCINIFLASNNFASAHDLLANNKKYAPRKESINIDKTIQNLKELKNYEVKLNSAIQSGKLSYEDKRLLQHTDMSVRMLVMKAASGDAESQFILGCFYDKGNQELSIPRDDDSCLKWLERASNQGYRDAKTRLGYIYLESGIISSDHSWRKRGVDLLEEASMMGDSQASRLLSEYRSSRNAAVAKGVASGCLGCAIPTVCAFALVTAGAITAIVSLVQLVI